MLSQTVDCNKQRALKVALCLLNFHPFSNSLPLSHLYAND